MARITVPRTAPSSPPPPDPPPAALPEAPPETVAASQPSAVPESAPGPVIGGADSGARIYQSPKLSASASAELRREIEELIALRTPDLSDDGGLHFSESQRAEIMRLTGAIDPDSILQHIRNLVSARADGGAEPLVLVFTSQQMERTAARCAAGENVRDKLQEFCDYGVNLETGLR